MARRLRIQYPDGFYHLTSPDNERRAVWWFSSQRDRRLLCHEGFSGQPIESEIQAEDISEEGGPENCG